MNDLISIILPVYNTAPYLEKTLDALRRQTYKNIEVLCIDDGSTDDSLAILRRFAQHDARFRVFTQENSGAGRARSVGLENMRGKYLMFCDSDDWYENSMCEVMVETMEREGVDLVECGAEIHSPIRSQRMLGTMEYFRMRQYRGRKYLDAEICRKFNVNLWNKIFKVQIIRDYHIVFLPIHLGEDAAFIFQYIIVAASYFGIEDKLYHYTIRELSMTEDIFLKQIPVHKRYDAITIMKYIAEFVQRNECMEKVRDWLWCVMENRLRSFSFHGLNRYTDKLEVCRMAKRVLRDIPAECIKNQRLLMYIKKGQFWRVHILLSDSRWIRILRKWRAGLRSLWKLNPISIGYLIGDMRGYMRQSIRQRAEIIALLRKETQAVQRFCQLLEATERDRKEGTRS